MSKQTELLRRVGVLNDYDFFRDGRPRVFLTYATSNSRSPIPARWLVHRLRADGVEVVTNPDAHWADHGRKSFGSYRHGGRRAALAEAQAWAGERYGITEWARTPFGGYGDAAFVRARLRDLRKQAITSEEATGAAHE